MFPAWTEFFGLYDAGFPLTSFPLHGHHSRLLNGQYRVGVDFESANELNFDEI